MVLAVVALCGLLVYLSVHRRGHRLG
jgi:hypothetical protein